MEKNNIYKKFQSFQNLKISNSSSKNDILKKIHKIFNENLGNLDHHFSNNSQNILKIIIEDLFSQNGNTTNQFSLKENSIAELNTFENIDVLKYLVHRYRYEIYPQKKIIDEYPPLIQIEPSSICNFRCVFCFETDKSFTNKKNGFMGTMKVELFKKIIDQIENNVQFVTLASRGEPLSERIDEMIKYTSVNKFKINTTLY